MANIFIDLAPTLPGSAPAGGGGGFANQLLGPNGTAAAPTYSFGSNANLGMYKSAANTLAFATNGILVGQVDTNGVWVMGKTTGSSFGIVGISAAMNWNGTAGQANAFTTGSHSDSMTVSGNDNVTAGGMISMYGQTHATKPNQTEFYQNNVIAGSISAGGAWAIKGTTGTDSAAAGYYGEYASSSLTGFIATSGGNGAWTDMLPLTLTPGDWDISLVESTAVNGSTMTSMAIGISSTSGNSATGMTEGDNWVESAAVPTGAIHESLAIPAWRRSIAVQTTFYAKFKAAIAAGAPTYICRISARRMR